MLPILADLPPQQHEMVVCAITAAIKYEIPANIMLAVAQKEGGKPGLWVQNKNGTHDIGAMQFNTAYLQELKQYGVAPEDVAVAGCYPYELAAWRIRRHIRDDSGDLWSKAANYHSRTPTHNQRYRADLIRKSLYWADWLSSRFTSQEIDALQAPPIMVKENKPEYTPRTITFSERQR